MINLQRNASVVIETLQKHQYKPSIVKMNVRCFTQLSEFMESEGIAVFTPIMAQQWCAERTAISSRDDFTQALLRLADVYEHGRVISSHLSLHGELSPEFSAVLESFTKSLPPEVFIESSIERYREACIMFFRFCQMSGICSIAEIDFTILEMFHGYIAESERSGYEAYEGCAERMLLFLAETTGLKYGYGLYLHYARSGKSFFAESLSAEIRQKIDNYKTDSPRIMPGDFYPTVLRFIELIRAYGYSSNVIHGHFYRLRILCIFLDQGDLGYSREIADVWADALGEKLFGNSKMKALNRTLDLFDNFLTNSDCIEPKGVHASRKSVYAELPPWCQSQIDYYAETRKREGMKDRTILKNTYACAKFCRFLLSEGLESFEELTAEQIKSFNLWDLHKSPAGKNMTNQTIFRFLLYMEFRGTIRLGLHDALPCCSQRGEKIVTVLSNEDKEKINHYCMHANTPIQLRDAAILKLATNTALRGVDIIMLRTTDIDWKNRCIKVIQSKTGKEHIHPVDTASLNALFRYIRDGRAKESSSDRLFLSSRAPFEPVVNSEVCRQAMQRAGLSTTEFHRIRRTYATDTLKAGATFREAAELLGHSATDSIHKYTQLDEERMRLCPLSLAETGLKMDGRYCRV